MAETGTAPPRTALQREADVRQRWESDMDVWVATSSSDGRPCMVPLSFVHVDGVLLMSTRRTTPTARNLRDGGRAVLGIGGHTRDVVHIEADVEPVGAEGPTEAEGRAFAAKTGWDPRGREDYVFLRFRPVTLRAWREEHETPGRVLMRDGRWRTGTGSGADGDR